MITEQEVIEYGKNLLTSEKIEVPDVTTYIKTCIYTAKKSMWNAWNWTFKYKNTTLAVTASSTSTNLPDDFAAMRTIREQETTYGNKLWYLAKEEFDQKIPNQDAYPEGTPRFYTVYRDIDDDLWKIAFYPMPDSAMTLYIDYATKVPGDLSLLPERCHPAFYACLRSEIYPASHRGKVVAMREKIAAVEELKIRDRVDGARMVIFKDGSNEPTRNRYQWFGPWSGY